MPTDLTLAHPDLALCAFALAFFIQCVASRTIRLADDGACIVTVLKERIAVKLHTARFQRFTLLICTVDNVVQKNARIAAHYPLSKTHPVFAEPENVGPADFSVRVPPPDLRSGNVTILQARDLPLLRCSGVLRSSRHQRQTLANLIRNFPVGIRFPILHGYMTLIPAPHGNGQLRP